MPKNKTHSGASKRFRVTGTGKILRQKAGLRHNLEKKASKVTRRMTGTTEVAKADVPARQEAARSLSTRPGVAPVATADHASQGVTQWHASSGQSTPTRSAGSPSSAPAGYRGQRSRLYRKAKEQVTHSLVYSYRDRKQARATSASSGSSGSTPPPAPTA